MPPKIETTTPEPKIEVRSVKHTYSADERGTIGSDLARAIGGLRGIEAEFDQVKASYKAKTTESEARIDSLSTNLVNGFDVRSERCVVVYHPEKREKHYFLEREYTSFHDEQDPGESLKPVLTEEMTAEDFQSELVQAESKFELRDEINLFPPTGTDRGLLVVGRLAGKWFSALRVTIGKLKLEERLDSEQKCFKARPDAIKTAVMRVKLWAKENLKDLSKGFEDHFSEVIDVHSERVE